MTEWGIDTLFNPSKRHMDEEKRRLQSTREEVGDSSGGKRIDLESGTVVISGRKSASPPDGATDETDVDRLSDDAADADAAAAKQVEVVAAEDARSRARSRRER
jgi:hypothetical protein